MATLGHVAMALVGARVYLGRRPGALEAMAWSALSLLPDGDVGMFAFVTYDHPLGHRGASHSLAAALALGILVGLAGRAAAERGWLTLRAGPDSDGWLRLAAFAAAVVATHGLLDTMTMSRGGGRGVALLWPLSAERFWAPWRPIPIAPIGLDMWSPRGLYVLAFEAAAFAPAFLWALWPAARRVDAGAAGRSRALAGGGGDARSDGDGGGR